MTQKKRKQGTTRPKLRTQAVSFRLTPETAEILKRLAVADLSSQATFLTRLLHREFERLKKR